MTQRGFEPANGGRMTVRALKCRLRLACCDLCEDHLLEPVVLLRCVTDLARAYRNVRVLHRTDIRILRYANVTRNAILLNVAGAVVVELYRVTLERAGFKIGLCRGMAA